MSGFTQTLRTKLLEPLIKRDNGFVCFYCEKQLKLDSYIQEHLNDNRKDNREENIVLACQSCNNKKRYDDSLKNIAIDKLIQNEKTNSLSVRENVDVRENSPEIDINSTNYEIAERFLNERLDVQDHIPFKDTLDSIVFLCKEQTGHGSQPAVRRYLDTLTSSVAPFEKSQINRKKVILRRKIRLEMA